jgi:pyridoxamine 5'-phosphate oxidase family protein
VERQPLRWVASAAALAVVVALGGLALGATAVVTWAITVSSAVLPLAVGAAILRYRLYDLDRQKEGTMSVFSDAEIDYLGSQRLGRLATVGQDGMPHVVPVAFRYNPNADSIDVGGHDFAKRKKFRDVKRTGMAALVVDDVLPPWQPRAVEVRGEASTLDTGGKAIMEGFDDPIIRITPRRIVSWGLEDGFQARSVE